MSDVISSRTKKILGMLGVEYGKNNFEIDNGKLLENRHEQDNGFEACTSLSPLLPVPFTAAVQLDNGNSGSHSNTYPDVEQINYNENIKTLNGVIIENNVTTLCSVEENNFESYLTMISESTPDQSDWGVQITNGQNKNKDIITEFEGLDNSYSHQNNLIKNTTNIIETTTEENAENKDTGKLKETNSLIFCDGESTVNDLVVAHQSSQGGNTKDFKNTSESVEIMQSEGRPKKGRKRKHASQTREIKKKKRNTNNRYINTKGTEVDPKEFRDYHCNCKCNEKLSIEERKNEFSKFWSIGSYEARALMLGVMISQRSITRRRSKVSEKRMNTRTYHICGVIVCKTFFLQTLRISSCVVDKALKKIKSNFVVKDNRGKAGGHNKLEECKTREVIDHINKYPRYVSHYSRSQTKVEFLPSDTTLPLMYNMYSSEYINPVSFSTYQKIFLTKFNLKRKKLKKDTCNLCDSLHSQIQASSSQEQKNKLENQHKTHIDLAKAAQKMMSDDMKKAKESNNTLECLTFDLEKTLPLPRIPTNIVFYKRQLWFYNCGIHNGSKNKGFCYVWVEGDAGRGAQEVGSCLRKYIKENIGNTNTELVLWSDSCGGQNRNIKMVLFLKSVLDEHESLQVITQRFLVSGHSFLPNDSDFGDIECALKLQQRIYLPSDYISIMEKCRKKNPFIVKKMTKEDFFSSEDLEKSITNRKKDINGDKINWLHCREIQLKKAKPFSIFLKTDLNQEISTEVDISKQQGRPAKQRRMFNVLLKPLWPEGKPISTPKLNDLKSLLHLIPNDCKYFYKKLIGSPDITDDIDGFSGEPDFEIDENY